MLERRNRLNETRQESSREENSRNREYRPPSTLPDPNPRPGLVHRWCAKSVYGELHASNMDKRLTEGWRPVDAADYPEITGQIYGHSGSGMIEKGGLILCVMDAELAESRQEYFDRNNKLDARRANDQIKSGNMDGSQYVKVKDDSTIQHERGRRIDFGNGN